MADKSTIVVATTSASSTSSVAYPNNLIHLIKRIVENYETKCDILGDLEPIMHYYFPTRDSYRVKENSVWIKEQIRMSLPERDQEILNQSESSKGKRLSALSDDQKQMRQLRENIMAKIRKYYNDLSIDLYGPPLPVASTVAVENNNTEAVEPNNTEAVEPNNQENDCEEINTGSPPPHHMIECCPICQEGLVDDVQYTECMHAYHKKCICDMIVKRDTCAICTVTFSRAFINSLVPQLAEPITRQRRTRRRRPRLAVEDDEDADEDANDDGADANGADNQVVVNPVVVNPVVGNQVGISPTIVYQTHNSLFNAKLDKMDTMSHEFYATMGDMIEEMENNRPHRALVQQVNSLPVAQLPDEGLLEIIAFIKTVIETHAMKN